MVTLLKFLCRFAAIAALGVPLATDAGIINIDFNGARNVPGPDVPGPTYQGQGAAGGGTTWNALPADSRLPDGSDDDNLMVGGSNLLDDNGVTTIVGFTVAPVGGDVCCAAPTTDPTDPLALLNDYIFNNSAGNSAGESPFTFSGLGNAATADLYFYIRSGSVTIPGATSEPFSESGIFTSANTIVFKDVVVSGGKITGTMGGGVAVLWGMSLQTATPFGAPTAPSVKSASPAGSAVRSNAPIQVELQDSTTLVAPNSIQLFLNGQAVSPTVNKVAGTNVTTVSYIPAGGLPESTNTVRIVFGNNANPPVVQTNDFSFIVINDVAAGLIVNIDFNGLRPDDTAGPTFVGQGAAGGGTSFNGLTADSTSGDDNITVSGNSLIDSIGGATSVNFTISPVGGDNNGAGTDPASSAALFGDYVFVGSAGQTTGTSDFNISGLGATPAVDLYFYFGANGDLEIPGVTLSEFGGNGIFTPANTRFFQNVPVSGGNLKGTFGKGPVAILNGLSIEKPAPKPFVKSVSPIGRGILDSSSITLELLDYVSEVATNSIQLILNGQAVTPTIIKPAGTNLTTISFQPTAPLPESTNTLRIVFGDNTTPQLVQTNDSSFVVISALKASTIINIDFNGVRNVPGPDVPGPTYVGQSAAGGGNTWNGILADSRLSDGTDEDNLEVGGTNLVNSIGGTTSVSFTVSPVGGDVGGAPTANPTSREALFSDYIFNNSAGNNAGESLFMISGLGDAPSVDIYFYRDPGTVSIPGVTTMALTPAGIFSSANTVFFKNVPVSGGTVNGNFGPGVTVVHGITISLPLPRPFVKSTSPTGGGISGDSPILVELQDYITQVASASIQLFLNGQAVTPAINKPAGTNVTTVSFKPVAALPPDSTNIVRIIFSDTSNPAIVQSNDFHFVVLNEATAARIINIDFNGVRNVPGPDVPGPTYVGQGAAGGGTVWNGILADSRLADGTDEDNLEVGGTNLVNSLGGVTTVSFTVNPVGGDVGGAPTTDPASTPALFGDYIFNNSAANNAGESPFTISGLGDAQTVDLYFYRGAGNVKITGTTSVSFPGSGIFTTVNTVLFKDVTVSNGTISGSFGPGTTVIDGLTINTALPQQPPPGPLSIRREGNSIAISWPGTASLESADEVIGPWVAAGATSPLTITPTAPRKFYRLKQ